MAPRGSVPQTVEAKGLRPCSSSTGKQRPSARAAMALVVAKWEGPPFISEAAVRGNAVVLDLGVGAGAMAGILGLTGLYLLASILLSLLLILKAGRRWNRYFKSRRPLFTGGLIGGLFTYVLFWTFLAVVLNLPNAATL
uniref:ER membrane protein complex subunit 6 n=1 Tax=Myotis myotis TaxID=51298 RepID=A0A7J7XZK7_MYOMY|nr:hypothetical protein mMyoMyo1_004453 [Myotis myotis]